MSTVTIYRQVHPNLLSTIVEESRSVPDGVTRYLLAHPSEPFYSEMGRKFRTERYWSALLQLMRTEGVRIDPLLICAIAGGTLLEGGGCYVDQPVRYLTEDKVCEVFESLRVVSESYLKSVYEAATQGNSAQNTLEQFGSFNHLWQTFLTIRAVFETSCESKFALLLWVC